MTHGPLSLSAYPPFESKPLRETLPYVRRQIRTHCGYGSVVRTEPYEYGFVRPGFEPTGHRFELSSTCVNIVRLDRPATTSFQMTTKVLFKLLGFVYKQLFFIIKNPTRQGGSMDELVACPLWSQRSEVWITAPTNVSLEGYLLEFMTDKKYQIIHMFHVGSVLQITLIRINMFKVCLRISLFKKTIDNL
jgi:hypothetical protein